MVALRMLCAMLLVFLGFAHKPIVASAASLPASASFVLPDGTVASLCLPGHDGAKDSHVDRGCDACRLASSIALPESCAEAQRVAGRPADDLFALPAGSFRRLNFPPSAPPRGPPSLPVSFNAA
jgi:hypothetical protein